MKSSAIKDSSFGFQTLHYAKKTPDQMAFIITLMQTNLLFLQSFKSTLNQFLSMETINFFEQSEFSKYRLSFARIKTWQAFA